MTATTSAKQTKGARANPPLDLVGCCFIIWGDAGRWRYQGCIRSRPEPGLYLCQFFECLTGYPTDLTILPIEAMLSKPWREPGSMILFEDDEQLRFWAEHRYRPPDDDAPKRRRAPTPPTPTPTDPAPKSTLVPFDESTSTLRL